MARQHHIVCSSCLASWREVWGEDDRITILSRRARNDCQCWQCRSRIKSGAGCGLLIIHGRRLVAAGKRGPWARTARLEGNTHEAA